MKVLFIGGTGNISTSCTAEALSRGIEVHHLNRGSGERKAAPKGVHTYHADIKDRDAVKRALGNDRFDVVVNWIAFTKEDVEADIAMFKDRTRHYIFISSASVYHKPPRHWIITESTPTYNPYWPYSQKKIECERRLFEAYEKAGFPMTVVRPSHTYSDGWFPTTFTHDYTVPKRMLDGKEVIVHGDGTSLWTITHTDDFAVGFTGLMGNPEAIGETFQITSDEALTWDQMHRAIGMAIGAEPKIVHMPSDFISRIYPEIGAGMLGDKAHSVVFDNTKIKRVVPDYRCRIPFHEGMRRSVAWGKAHPETVKITESVNTTIDTLLEKWEVLGR
jgi:nucleoside-diphosphate-sugar epimerase